MRIPLRRDGDLLRAAGGTWSTKTKGRGTHGLSILHMLLCGRWWRDQPEANRHQFSFPAPSARGRA